MVFRIAVVGLGKIATDQHLPCIAKNADFKLSAGVSRHARLDNVPCFESLGQLIASGMAIDAVALCTPPSVRLALARQAVRFTLSQDVTAAVPPGDERLWRMALDAAADFKPMPAAEQRKFLASAAGIEPIFRA